MTARWKVWAATAIGAVVIASGVGYAATYTDGNPGQLSLNAGDATHVHCPTQVGVGNLTGQDFDATCAPVPTTTTLPAPTTTTVPATTTTVPQTTTTVPATTTTLPAPPPSGFPTPSNTGVPAGAVMTAYTGPTTITACGTVIDHKIITSPITVNVGNGNAAIYTTEAAAKAAACVTFTNDLIKPTACGNGCGGIQTGFTTYAGGQTTCVKNTGKPCGPVFVADTEFNMPQSDSGGYNYTTYDTNVHAWRVYVHGTDQGMDSDGFSEVHDSYLAADRCNTTCTTHGDAFFQDGGAPNGALLDHNTFICGGTPGFNTDCAADVGFYGDNSPIQNMTVKNNLFKASSGQFGWCAYTGAALAVKPFPKGTNLVWTGNTFEKGRSGKCGDSGAVPDWAAPAGSGNVWSANVWDDGSPLNP